jgi:hypothetical protein
MKDIILGILLLLIGFLIGWTTHASLNIPPIDKMAKEIINLQKDVLRLEGDSAENYAHIQHLMTWRNSILFDTHTK